MDLIKKIYICDESINLNKDEKIHIMKIIKRHDPQKLEEFPDGIRIKLDDLPINVIDEIELYIKNRISNS